MKQENSTTPLNSQDDQNFQAQPNTQSLGKLIYPQVQQPPPQQQQSYPQSQQYIQVGEPNPGQPINPIAQAPVQMPIQNQQIIIDNQISPTIQFKTFPIGITCPFCNQNITTVIDSQLNIGYICCICLTGPLLWACLMIIMNKEFTFSDVVHKCPICGFKIGSYNAC